jgi:nucleoid-associated protein YgaU
MAAMGVASSGGGGAPGAPSPTGDSSRSQVQRASLNLYDSKPATGGRKIGSELGTINFQFNPKELTIAKSAKWERKAQRGAKQAAPPEFRGANPCKMTLEMFFDASGTHDGSVVMAVEKLFSCCVPTEKTAGDNKAIPPMVVFKWGDITSFPGFITSVSVKYSLFSSSGTPIRATCTITLEEMPGGAGAQNPTSGSLAVRRVHRIVENQSLATVAFDEYGDANLWRPLAKFNRVDDPVRLPVGTMVMIPSLAELEAGPELAPDRSR